MIEGAATIGVGGARLASPAAMACGWSLVSSLLLVRPAVLVSCGSGVPELVRLSVVGAAVYSASDPLYRGQAALPRRATAMVRALGASVAPLWVCFPGITCPSVAASGVGRSWRSCGSGSWSECRMAAGLGVRVLVFLPVGVQPPSSWGGWSCLASSAGGRWFLRGVPSNALTLF